MDAVGWEVVGWALPTMSGKARPTTQQSKPPGVARQLVTFFCFAKKKVTQEKATPVCRPLRGFPQSDTNERGCATRPGGAHTPRPTAGLEQCSPKPPLPCGWSRRRTGDGKAKNQNLKIVGWALPTMSGKARPTKIVRAAHTKPLCFFSPERRRVAQAGQEVSARTVWARSASSAAAWPAEQRRVPRSGGKPGATSLGYLSWQDKKGNLLPGNPRRFW